MDRVAAALARARSPGTSAPPPEAPRRAFAIGDPQCSCARFFAVLDAHGLLGDDGWLARDVRLVSLGDHFDYHGDVTQVAEEGEALLQWLAAHDPAQVTILFGNHDAVRVVEFAFETDASFAEARRLADACDAAKTPAEKHAACESFHTTCPGVPTPGLASRDFAAFAERQRALVQRLLLTDRFRLAAAVTLADGRAALCNHAGLTQRELGLLCLPAAPPPVELAEFLQDFLRAAVARVRPLWEAGASAALELAPVHVGGVPREEGGGLLYHRPAHPDLAGGDTPEDRAWAFAASRPRRFDPRHLPPGLVQLCGHTAHRRCRKELAPWASADALSAERASVRTLTAHGAQVRYELGVRAAPADAAVIVLADPALHLGGAAELVALRP